MFMYSLTIQPPTAITQAILGQFAGTKEQQIVTASGSKLTIHRPDPTQGKVIPLYTQDVFGIIRTLAAFRLAGSSKGMFLRYPLSENSKIILVIRQASRAT
jgi:splicing factor 3B subunit 3